MLVTVTTVPLGDPATFTCSFSAEQLTNNELHWYKQGAGNTLTIIVKLRKHAEPAYGAGFSASRVNATNKEDVSSLTIIRTVQEDEGMYHCAIIDWTENIWHGIYLVLEGHSERILNYQVVQEGKVSDPVHESNLATLQCSVISAFNHNICPEDIIVFWSRSKSDKSDPDVIYADGERHDECQKKSEFQRRCVFSKNISRSDAGTYYSAVASCGEIYFGNGTNQQVEQTPDPDRNALVITTTCLIISLIVNIIVICYRNPRAVCKQIEGTASPSSPASHDNTTELGKYVAKDNQDLNYAALHFSGGKCTRRTKMKLLDSEKDVFSRCIYQVKV
ncbi:uncharacterized protein LOC124860805 [Girardinichthys multiradiatus]|uniref:uncharacterized protein LOC124860805 n=1 Tax=Girardinichthys multiradiatus TaxID=208333 RepID=UPI001FACDCF9|nr:uncharacterized protein LOC124860805 [Girardinichthys multiradiatus]